MSFRDAKSTVEVEDLRREFKGKEGRVLALDGVDLKVREGEVYGVLGPNGAGKTTMIRILSTLLLPSSGSARVMGWDVAKQPEKVRPLISTASGAERAGYDYITARGNLWFFSQLYGLPSKLAHERINEFSEMLGLTDYLDRKFYTLSTGYRQRVTVVRAFINDPKVVFLDEPTIGLDVMTALKIREFLVKQAKESGRTILLATHNMAEVDAICNRVGIIDKGKILACDTPMALKRSLGAPALVMEMTPAPDSASLAPLSKLEGVKGFTSYIDEERGVGRVQVVVDSDESAQGALDFARKSGMNLISNWRQQTTFAFLGGVMVSFWGNVLWSMASQFNWDKQQGLFELYVTSPAPISAILIGMSLGGILGTAPSAMTLAIIGWLLFAPPATPLWPLVALTFALTLASLYAMGMALSSLYLVYGREADSVNEALHEPVSFLSGVYFPSSLAFPAALQAVVLIIPLAVGMDALQRTLFSLNSTGATDLTPVYRDLLLLAIMGITLLFAASKALKILEEKGRRAGTIRSEEHTSELQSLTNLVCR